MHFLPPILLLTCGMSIGLYMATQCLRGKPNRYALIGLHFFLGAAATETFMLLLHGAPNGTALPRGPWATASLTALVVTLISGIMMPLLAKSFPRAGSYLLFAHAVCAVTALSAVVYFLTNFSAV